MQNADINFVQFTEKDKQRFFSHVVKTDSCWLWNGGVYSKRYGGFKIGKRVEAAHRVSFVMHGGKITPEKPQVLHDCPDGDNGLCVNPDHLWAGTQTENILDMETKGRSRHPAGADNGMRKHPESVQRGTRQSQSKLTEETVKEIFETCRNGKHGVKQITADRLGVSHGLIGHIIHGRAWNHVTGLPKFYP